MNQAVPIDHLGVCKQQWCVLWVAKHDDRKWQFYSSSLWKPQNKRINKVIYISQLWNCQTWVFKQNYKHVLAIACYKIQITYKLASMQLWEQ